MSLEQRVAVLEAEVARLKQVRANEENDPYVCPQCKSRTPTPGLCLRCGYGSFSAPDHAYDCVQVQK